MTPNVIPIIESAIITDLVSGFVSVLIFVAVIVPNIMASTGIILNCHRNTENNPVMNAIAEYVVFFICFILF